MAGGGGSRRHRRGLRQGDAHGLRPRATQCSPESDERTLFTSNFFCIHPQQQAMLSMTVLSNTYSAAHSRLSCTAACLAGAGRCGGGRQPLDLAPLLPPLSGSLHALVVSWQLLMSAHPHPHSSARPTHRSVFMFPPHRSLHTHTSSSLPRPASPTSPSRRTFFCLYVAASGAFCPGQLFFQGCSAMFRPG